MQFSEYVYPIVKEDNPSAISKQDSTNALREFEALVKSYAGLDSVSNLSAITRQLLEEKANARKNAPEKKGKFPLLILLGGKPFFHTMLAEQLAAKGFVVASFPRLGSKAGERFPFSQVGMENGRRDIAFLITSMKNHTNINTSQMALVNWSFEGAYSILASMHDSSIKAIVSLDAASGYGYGKDLLLQSNSDIANKFKLPFIHFTGDFQAEAALKDFSFSQSLSHTPVYFVTAQNMQHRAFTSFYNKMLPLIVEQLPPDNRIALDAYQHICDYTLHFLKAHLQGHSKSLKKLKKSSKDFLKIEHH
ncbi:MAG: hypothetical protein IPJ74_14175 [Saprospiraceae bacterium]|nr:hypothetical protein [Saprospiraceae bacterium]